MSKLFDKRSVLALVVGMFSSCATPGPAAHTTAGTGFSEPATALVVDPDLAEELVIDSQRLVAGMHSDVRMAETVLYNFSAKPLRVQCRTIFKNADGITVETSPWRDVFVPAYGRTTDAAPTVQRGDLRFLTQIRRHADAAR